MRSGFPIDPAALHSDVPTRANEVSGLLDLWELSKGLRLDRTLP